MINGDIFVLHGSVLFTTDFSANCSFYFAREKINVFVIFFSYLNRRHGKMLFLAEKRMML